MEIDRLLDRANMEIGRLLDKANMEIVRLLDSVCPRGALAGRP